MQRNFEGQPAKFTAIPIAGTGSPGGPPLSDGNFTVELFPTAARSEDGLYVRCAVAHQSAGLEGEK